MLAELADARCGVFDLVAQPVVFLFEFLVGHGEDLDLPGVGLDLVFEFCDLRGMVTFTVLDLAGERDGPVAELG